MKLFELFGDIVLKGAGEVEKSLKGIEGVVKSTSNYLEKHKKELRDVGAALTAVGAAGLKLTDDARKLNAQLGQTAMTLGVSTKEMRDLAIATANTTFPLQDVLNTFDLLSRAGVKNTSELQNIGNAFSDLGTAIGMSSEAVGEILIPAFRVFGQELPQTARELDSLTWLTKNTTVDLSEFGSVMTYVAANGADLGLTLDDMVSILAALESKGVSGSAATRTFRTAISEASREGKTLNEVLGISQDQIDYYSQELSTSTGITKDYADVAATSVGIIDKVKDAWQKLSLQLGSVLEPLEGVFAGLTAIGPLLISLPTLVRGFSAVLGVMNSVLLSSPLFILAAAISGVVLAFSAMIRGTESDLRKFDTSVRDSMGGFVASAKSAFSQWEASAEAALLTANANLDAQEARERQYYNDKMASIKAEYGEREQFDEDYGKSKMQLAKEVYDDEVAKLKAAADADRDAAQSRLDFYSDKAYERMRIIDEVMLAELAAIDPTVAAIVNETNVELAEIDARKEARRAAEEQSRIDKLETQLLAEDLTEDDRLRLERELGNLTDQQRERQLLLERNNAIASLEMENYYTGELKRIDDTLEEEKIALDEAHQEKLNQIEIERKAKEEAATAEWIATATRIIYEKKANKEAFEDSKKYYQGLLSELNGYLEGAKTSTWQFVQDINSYFAQIKRPDLQVDVPEVVQQTYESLTSHMGEEEGKEVFESLMTGSPLPSYQTGGPIIEDTILYGLNSGPYAMAHAGEQVVAGAQTANIVIEMDGHTLAKAMGVPLTKFIRGKTGLKI